MNEKQIQTVIGDMIWARDEPGSLDIVVKCDSVSIKIPIMISRSDIEKVMEARRLAYEAAMKIDSVDPNTT